MEADRRERLSEVLVLLEQMEKTVSELQNPIGAAPEAATQPGRGSP